MIAVQLYLWRFTAAVNAGEIVSLENFEPLAEGWRPSFGLGDGRYSTWLLNVFKRFLFEEKIYAFAICP
jgi:hypothetical protein